MIMKKETIDKIVKLVSDVHNCSENEIRGSNEHISEYCSPYQCREIISELVKETNDEDLKKVLLKLVISSLSGLGYYSKLDENGNITIEYDEKWAYKGPVFVWINDHENSEKYNLFIGYIKVRDCKIYLLEDSYRVDIEYFETEGKRITLDKIKEEMEISLFDFRDMDSAYGEIREIYEKLVTLHLPIDYQVFTK